MGPFILFRRGSTVQSSRHMETFTIRLECVVGHTTWSKSLQVYSSIRTGIAAPCFNKSEEQKEREKKKKGEWEGELPLCNHFLIPDIWYSFEIWTKNSLLSSQIPASCSPASLTPVALRNCSEVSFQEDALSSGHREMTSPLRAPTAQSLSVRPGWKTISASEPLQQMCPFQCWGEGSRVKADNNRQSCAIQNPWSRDALCSGRLEPAFICGRCVCSQQVFEGICVGQVVSFTAHQCNVWKIIEINDKNA